LPSTRKKERRKEGRKKGRKEGRKKAGKEGGKRFLILVTLEFKGILSLDLFFLYS
jgi:hypothetical protein